ncbi:MAG: DMT family transporter [Burkholderiales bacterium]|nr:MAG: DMT family transporter [Burkholderiales bacterium]
MRPESLALLAAACWAVGSIFSAKAASHMGAFSFTRWRLFFALTVLWALCLMNGHWRSLQWDAVLLLVASGLVGIFVGDTALFACMNRLGPRRCGVLFATHALFSVALAWVFLGETLWGWALLGSLLLVGGVMVAVAWGRRADETHDWEQTRGKLRMGIALGLIAALGQAVATLMLKPLMGTGLDAITASAVRTSASFAAHALLWAGGLRLAQLQNPLNASVLWNTFASATVAMALGMTLILAALRSGQANLVGVFSSVTPVILLPLLWLVYRRRPAWGAWLGAAMAVGGTSIILLLK